MDLHRVAVPFINAIAITVILFSLMHSLIDIDDPELRAPITIPVINPVFVPKDETLKIAIDKLPLPELVEEMPLVPDFVNDFNFKNTEETVWHDYDRHDFDDGGSGLVSPDRQLVIAIGFPPQYPASALRRNIEGYAIVGFSVSASGLVTDPFIIESEPNTIFDRSALKAISKFKYKPRLIDGRAVKTDGQRYQFTYQLDK